jgi:pyrroline-5-carboxylate reductase
MRDRNSVVFLGGGRITGAICAGLRLAGFEEPIVVYDRNPAKLRALRRESRVEMARDLKSATERADLLIVAVQPAAVAGLLDEVAACRVSASMCVSLAAGIPLRKLRGPGLRDQNGVAVRWVRAMPSPVCRIRRGLTAVSFDGGVSKAERARVRRFFALVGQVLEISEPQFDAFTAAYSSSHGYHALATLASAAQKAGLDRATALTAAAHALSDGVGYWRQSGLPLADLLHEAITPGGIAAATMSAMDKAGYARVVAKGLKAGIEQARRNAKR